MAVSKLYLCNFSPERVSEDFFAIFSEKIGSFNFCPCFYESFKRRDLTKDSIVFEKYLSKEVIGCCLRCKKKIISDTTNCEEYCDDFFNDLKKILIQCFCVNT